MWNMDTSIPGSNLMGLLIGGVVLEMLVSLSQPLESVSNPKHFFIKFSLISFLGAVSWKYREKSVNSCNRWKIVNCTIPGMPKSDQRSINLSKHFSV